jgi:glycosyltransferase involved in cell wall biosynthesis
VPTRICFVLPSLNGGGAERAAVQVLNGLDGARWQRSFYLFDREGPYLRDVDPAIAVHGGSSRSRIGRWRQLRAFLRTTRPRIVMSFLSYFSVLSATRGAAVGARVVFNQQTPMSAFLTDADYRWRGPWRRRAFSVAARIGFRMADAIVVSSGGVADDLVASVGLERGRVRVVHNPVDLEAVTHAAVEPLAAAHEAAWGRPAIVAAGRLADAKNYPLLLDALAIVRRTVPARLFILGAGDRESALRDHVAALGLTGAVVFCGFQSNPWKYIARADVLALSSRYEGFGNVLIEAMACGVPVVATASPGTRDIVTADTGLLVESHEPEAFAAALSRVLVDAPLRARFATHARSSAARFSVPTIVAAYDRVLAEVIA